MPASRGREQLPRRLRSLIDRTPDAESERTSAATLDGPMSPSPSPRSTTQRSRPSWGGRAALVIGSAAVSLLLAELALRVLGIAPERFTRPAHLESADKRLALDAYPDDPRGYFPIDLRDREERDRLRAQGLADIDRRVERTPFAVPLTFGVELCRGAPIAERADGEIRVVVIGDSFTEGQGVREEDTFVARLGARLEGAQLINCGRRGYDFPELAASFDRHLALAPDVVVYAMILNDAEQSEAFHARQAYLDDWILDRRRMIGERDEGAPPPLAPRLWSLLEDRVEAERVGRATTAWYREMFGAANQPGWAATLAHLERMDREMRARGGALVVALWPLMIDLDGEYPFAAVHRTIVEALAHRGIAVHDTLAAFRGRDPRTLWVHPADRHPNEEGHAIFAAELEAPLRAAIERERS
jgi:lysophospholipase L1-like esterase